MTFLSIEVRTRNPDIDGAVDSVLDAVLHDVVTAARDSMERSKHGRYYTLPGKVGKYRASAPGEPPGIRTGTLYASVTSFRTADGGVIQASTEYAGYLEHGTSKMEPRPFLGPAARKAVRRKPTYERLFKMEVEG